MVLSECRLLAGKGCFPYGQITPNSMNHPWTENGAATAASIKHKCYSFTIIMYYLNTIMGGSNFNILPIDRVVRMVLWKNRFDYI